LTAVGQAIVFSGLSSAGKTQTTKNDRLRHWINTRALSAFALRDLNMTKIESRPLRGKPWEYLFYLDFVGREDEPRVQNALRHLGELADFCRVLGSYPKGN